MTGTGTTAQGKRQWRSLAQMVTSLYANPRTARHASSVTKWERGCARVNGELVSVTVEYRFDTRNGWTQTSYTEN